jgi:hypothetical protein
MWGIISNLGNHEKIEKHTQKEKKLPSDDVKVVAAIFGIMFLFGLSISWMAAKYGRDCTVDDDLPFLRRSPADSQFPSDEVDGLPDVP